MVAAGKLSKPLVPGILFLGAIGLTSFPAYVEGMQEIRNEPDYHVDQSGFMRRVGIYCLLGGYGILFIARRGSIPFMPPKMKNLF